MALLLNNLGFNDTCVLPFTGAINSQNIFNLCETEEIGSSCQQTRLFKLYSVASDWFMRSINNEYVHIPLFIHILLGAEVSEILKSFIEMITMRG